jgi:hypothetical protein
VEQAGGGTGRDQSETEYIGMCLREMHSFAHDMNCHVQILAHPAKMDRPRGRGAGRRPGWRIFQARRTGKTWSIRASWFTGPKLFETHANLI